MQPQYGPPEKLKSYFHVKLLCLTDTSEGLSRFPRPHLDPTRFPSHATDGKLLVLCHLGLELRRSSVCLQPFCSDRFSPVGEDVFFQFAEKKLFFWEMAINGDDQFFFWELVSFSRGIGLDLDLDVSAVSFPSPPPRKIRKNNYFWHLFFCRGFFAEKTQTVSKNWRIFFFTPPLSRSSWICFWSTYWLPSSWTPTRKSRKLKSLVKPSLWLKTRLWTQNAPTKTGGGRS